MMRSPLAYPLNRSADMEGGGAADLQTDIMRFMAILSLCLMAIFALVQSMPLTSAVQAVALPVSDPVVESVEEPVDDPVVEPVSDAVVRPFVVHAEAPLNNNAGISLRFASDAALMRLVATGQIGLYAISAGRAQRMTVRNSRISFWDASTPKAFHEMEATTVPGVVVDALTRTAIDFDAVSWGVTLPGKLKTQLDTLMQQHDNGSLVIDANGDILWGES